MNLTLFSRGVTAVALAAAAAGASAGTVAWTDWTAISTTAATGTMGGVAVTATAVTGVMNGPSQTGCGTNYWTQPNPALPAYTGGTVSNAPTACEQVALSNPVTVRLDFASAIDSLYMALVSVGQPAVTVSYSFDHVFDLDSAGVGYWSGGVPGGYTINGTSTALSMNEFHGVLHFAGPITSLTFSTNPGENWHAFTVGSAVPEPASLGLVALALLGAGVAARRRG